MYAKEEIMLIFDYAEAGMKPGGAMGAIARPFEYPEK